MIIGTAGHIDHGKTSLVRALTGVETDRLKEERERGISIELGYAYQALPNGDMLGFIDVPGHEGLVRTMIAGATGIDFALLVVAADDGVMPQTIEHLEILNLLAVNRGAVAITKIDAVLSERVDAIRDEVTALLAGTALAAAPAFPVCAPSGAGLDALRSFLHQQAITFRRPPDGGFFRLAIDRSFSLTGTGTVVTGTVFSGSVSAEDTVRLLPGGPLVRVRHVRAQNQVTERSNAGQRCALNLTGVAANTITRGMWAVDPELDLTTERLDARVRLLGRENRPLKHWSPVHVHLGTTSATGRIALLECEELAPGASAVAQIVLARPVHAVAGDLLILRDASAVHTIGGGSVIDPQGPPRRRKTPERLARLATLEQADPAVRLEAVVRTSHYGVDLGAFRRSQNVRAPILDTIADCLRVPPDSPAWLVAREHWNALAARLAASLADYHAKTPDEIGVDSGRLRRIAFPQLENEVYQRLLDELLASGMVRRSGPWIHMPNHVVRLTPEEEALARRVLPILDRSKFDPPWVRHLARLQTIDEEKMRRLLKRLARQGELFQVTRDLFYTKSAVTQLANIAAELARQSGAVKAAEFRDRTSLGRKRAIQILEFFDRVGYTRRTRDTHRMRGDVLLQLNTSVNMDTTTRCASP